MAVMLTARAAEEVKRVQQDPQFQDDTYLRIGVTGGGCSGLGYTMGFDSDFDQAGDAQFDCDGVKVVVNRKMALYLDGTTVDWFESDGQRGFTFDNPNVVRSCGCGGGSCH